MANQNFVARKMDHVKAANRDPSERRDSQEPKTLVNLDCYNTLDPLKALEDLATDLGTSTPALLEAMEGLGDGAGSWTDHIPYRAAESYFEDESVRSQYCEHVNNCAYCSTLLRTISPTEHDVKNFTNLVRTTLHESNSNVSSGRSTSGVHALAVSKDLSKDSEEQ
jgi:hypothetical protein